MSPNNVITIIGDILIDHVNKLFPIFFKFYFVNAALNYTLIQLALIYIVSSYVPIYSFL